MMSELASSDAERWQYLLYAIQGLVFAENALGEWANRDITLLKLDVLRSLDKEKLDESKVDHISTALGQANGYAFLALRDINNASIGSAMKLVEKGLAIDRSNLWLIRQHVNLIKRTSPSDWNARRKALVDYESIYTTKFDITLTFDEVGKGEWYGPLVVVCVALTPSVCDEFRKLGARDSKTLSKDSITTLAKKINSKSFPTRHVILPPSVFNEKVEEFKKEFNSKVAGIINLFGPSSP